MYIHNSTSCYQTQYWRGTCRVLGVLTSIGNCTNQPGIYHHSNHVYIPQTQTKHIMSVCQPNDGSSYDNMTIEDETHINKAMLSS